MSERTVPRGVKLSKAPTGIQGFDEITGGGLPQGRPTLVCGGPGCGKTLFGIEVLIHGAVELDEPGVFVSFEESAIDLAKNVASLGYDMGALIEDRKLAVDHVRVERSEIEETGEYDLDGLFLRIGFAIDSIGAKRIVLDTVEALFAALPNEGILRAELRRLFGWLKDKGVTAVITGERGNGMLTRRGLEEYVSDCVVVLDQRVQDQLSTRRLRIVKYRGSSHGTNEYPFLIQEKGFSILPTTSLSLAHAAPTLRVSTGVPGLDAMLGGKGVFQGSSVLVTGTAGSGKSSLSAHFVAASCARGKRCLYFAFEESQSQILRNMKSIGIDLAPFVENGLLQFHVGRPTLFGLEMHLSVMRRQVESARPDLVVVDPITNLISAGTQQDVTSMLVRFVDFLKMHDVTGVFTSLTTGNAALEKTDAHVSSLMDTWILLRFVEGNGERNRALYVLKSRGMPHSNQIREVVISDRGMSLVDVYTGSEGVLTGTARYVQEAKEKSENALRRQEAERKRRDLERRRHLLEAQILAARAELEAVDEEEQVVLEAGAVLEKQRANDRDELGRTRKEGHLEPREAIPANQGESQ